MDLSAFAETGAWRPRSRVERDETRVNRCDEDPPAARSTGPGGRSEPGRDAAVRKVAVVAGEIELGVEGPALPAGRAVDRPHAAERRRDVQDSIDEDRRRFAPRLRASDAVVAGSIRPSWRQRRDIGTGDLIGRRVLRATRIARVSDPLDRSSGGTGNGDRRHRGHRNQNATQASTHFVKHMSGSQWTWKPDGALVAQPLAAAGPAGPKSPRHRCEKRSLELPPERQRVRAITQAVRDINA